jgi:hypothetical protein
MFNSKQGDATMTTLKKSLQTLGSIAAVGGMLAAAPLPAVAQQTNPCAPKAANPCAGKKKGCESVRSGGEEGGKSV